MDLRWVDYRPGRVARVILNRPDRLNAQSWGMIEDMDRAFNHAVADPECRVIVLSGAGRAFSSGHDFTSDEQLADVDARRDMDPFARGLFTRETYVDSHIRWRDLPKPTIAMVHGHCFWGGWMLATTMDILYAAEDATFLTTYGDYFTTAWDVGPRKAKEILFGNQVITAQEAMAWGFVNRVFPADRLESETLRYAERVAEQDPAGNRLTKFMINQAEDGKGYTTAARAAGVGFITRRHEPPRPGAAPPAARPTPRKNFARNRIAQAMAYFTADRNRN
jgi:enoyl-CoA hydratase